MVIKNGKIKIGLHNRRSFMREFYPVIVSIFFIPLLSFVLSIGIIYEQVLGTVFISLILFFVLWLTVYSFCLPFGRKIIIDNLAQQIIVRKGKWERGLILKKKFKISIESIVSITYQKQEKCYVVHGLSSDGFGYRDHEEKITYKDRHAIIFLLSDDKQIDVEGYANTWHIDANGKKIDIAEKRTREIVKELNEFLKQLREAKGIVEKN